MRTAPTTTKTTTTAAPRLAVVGSGIAGLYAALLAADAGLDVTLLSKGALEASNTHHAQGGICAVLEEGMAAHGDSVSAHVADTLRAGAGLGNEPAVRALCGEASADIAALESYGVRFDTDATGRPSLGLEAAHGAARILHAGGDATGAGIADALIRTVLSYVGQGRIRLLQDAFLTDLTTAAGRVRGLRYLPGPGAPANSPQELDADAVLLATGGAGQLFEHTTNPQGATADGLAAAWRAGAAVADAEFFQFHPTALAVDGNFMISEAVRGEGAVLRDATGYRFLPDFHPDAELAPRDVVARSIVAHLAAIGADPEVTVYLDATGIEKARGQGFLAARFPTIAARTAALGFDWTTEWLPVLPAAHYWMGGIATDLSGRTSLPGLLAAGEVACTGVHGANRLASNSLLEGLVFARRAVATVSGRPSSPVGHDETTTPTFNAVPALLGETAAAEFDRAELQGMMSRCAAVVRDEGQLAVAAKQLAAWRAAGTDRDAHERENLRTAASLLVHAALHRTNSVGAHYRADFPDQPDCAGHACWVSGAAPASILESDVQ